MKIICTQSEYDDFVDSLTDITGMNERCSNCDIARCQIDCEDFTSLGYDISTEYEELENEHKTVVNDCRTCLYHDIDFEIVEEEE